MASTKMRRVAKIAFMFAGMAALLILALRFSWYWFMEQQNLPEWFIGISGFIFILFGAFIYRGLKNPAKAGLHSTSDALKFLSPAEKEVLSLLLQGLSNAEIAEKRHTSINTAKTHISGIYKKLGIRSRSKLIAIFSRTEKPGTLD